MKYLFPFMHFYGNLCAKGKAFSRIAEVRGKTSLKVTSAAGARLAKGKYYKFIAVALDGSGKVVSTSKVIHAATKGGKAGNYKKVTVKGSVVTKARKLRKGKTLKLGASAVRASRLKVKSHRMISYESSNEAIASVSGTGVVKGKQKGTCYIFAYAQNGVYRKIKIVVK